MDDNPSSTDRPAERSLDDTSSRYVRPGPSQRAVNLSVRCADPPGAEAGIDRAAGSPDGPTNSGLTAFRRRQLLENLRAHFVGLRRPMNERGPPSPSVSRNRWVARR